MTVKTRRMKILMVGLGGIGQRHARNLRAFFKEDVDLLAYRVRGLRQTLTDKLTVEEGVDLEQKYRITPYREFEEALEQKPDVVFVTNPTSLHIKTALRAAEEGCHLFIEKPLSHSLEDIDRLVALAKKKSLVTFVAYPLRFHPGLKIVQDLLEKRSIGPVVSARLSVGEYLPNWHPYEDYRRMYASRADLGGGVILTQIHEFDSAYRFFGMPRRLFTVGGKNNRLEIDVEDTASTLMEYHLDGKKIPVHIYQDYLQKPPYRTFEIFGQEGRILWDYHGNSVQLFSPEDEAVRTFALNGFVRNQMFTEELKHFFACVNGNARPLVTVRDGANSLKMALAAKRSLETGEVMFLEQPAED